MIPAHVKAKVKQKEINWWLYLINFYKKYFQNLKYNFKRAVF